MCVDVLYAAVYVWRGGGVMGGCVYLGVCVLMCMHESVYVLVYGGVYYYR